MSSQRVNIFASSISVNFSVIVESITKAKSVIFCVVISCDLSECMVKTRACNSATALSRLFIHSKDVHLGDKCHQQTPQANNINNANADFKIFVKTCVASTFPDFLIHFRNDLKTAIYVCFCFRITF